MYYEFNNTVKMISGENCLVKLPSELQKLGAKRVLLISGPVLNRIGTVQKIKDLFTGSDILISATFIDVPNDSSVEVVNELVNIYYNNSCDSILAVGGGSVLDTAKGLRLMLCQESKDLLECCGVNGLRKGKTIPFVAIPTTAGTGSEVTKVSVISDLARHIKMEFISSFILPSVCFLAPQVIATLPRKATVSSCFDALTHAIEAYTGLQKNPLSDTFALEGIRYLAKHLQGCLDNPEDAESRLGTLNGSALAGIAFSNSMVSAVHAIGHALGGVCKVSHDVAMAVLLPHCMQFNLDVNNDLYGDILYYVAGEEIYQATAPELRGQKCIDHIKALLVKYHDLVGLPKTLTDLNIEEDKFQQIANTAYADGAVIVNRKFVSKQDILDILRKAI
ncbi:MAG: iron-containing alcohol dehydrogenase [Clostridia bacterium]